MSGSVWIDVETKKSLVKLRQIKAMRDIRNGKQQKLKGGDTNGKGI